MSNGHRVSTVKWKKNETHIPQPPNRRRSADRGNETHIRTPRRHANPMHRLRARLYLHSPRRQRSQRSVGRQHRWPRPSCPQHPPEPSPPHLEEHDCSQVVLPKRAVFCNRPSVKRNGFNDLSDLLDDPLQLPAEWTVRGKPSRC